MLSTPKGRMKVPFGWFGGEDDQPEDAPDPELDAAACKVQAAIRGRLARKQVKEHKESGAAGTPKGRLASKKLKAKGDSTSRGNATSRKGKGSATSRGKGKGDATSRKGKGNATSRGKGDTATRKKGRKGKDGGSTARSTPRSDGEELGGGDDDEATGSGVHSRLTVTLLDARDLMAADKGGKSDPYFVLSLGGVKRKSATVKKTLCPTYNESFHWTADEPDRLLGDGTSVRTLLVECFDWDRKGADDAMGVARLPLDDLALDAPEGPTEHTLPLSRKRGGGAGWVRLSVSWEPEAQRGGEAEEEEEEDDDGEWDEPEPPAKAGVARYPNGDCYVGECKAGVKEGVGRYTFANGDCYVGGWSGDVMAGRGIYRFAGGDAFAGRYADGLRHGAGKLRYACGDVFDGSWAGGVKEGRGVHRFGDGRAEVGTYSKGAEKGVGARWSADRQRAWRLVDGAATEEISTDAARAIAAEVMGSSLGPDPVPAPAKRRPGQPVVPGGPDRPATGRGGRELSDRGRGR